MAKNITLLGASYSDVPAVQLPRTEGGTATFYDASETETITQNGTYDVTYDASVVVNVSGGGGSSKNIQVYSGIDYVRATSYTETDVRLTCTKTGTYNISWMGWRNTTSSTSGSRAYVNGTAIGTAHQSFRSSYGQYCEETNVQLDEGDVIDIRARARSTSYYMYVGNLIIEEV